MFGDFSVFYVLHGLYIIELVLIFQDCLVQNRNEISNASKDTRDMGNHNSFTVFSPRATI